MVKKQADLFQSTAPVAYQNLSDTQRIDWLRLMRTDRIGAVTFRDLLNHFGTAQTAIEQLNGRKFGKRSFQISTREEAVNELSRLNRYGAKLVALGETGYPRWLQSVDGAPPLLTVKGDLSLGNRPAIAIVGSRNASGAGLKIAGQLAHELGRLGLVVCSGLARGIDASAHAGAIKTGTIAVLGGGIDHIYPAQNEELYKKISETGLIISERPIGFFAQPKDFPRRNRLISGLSLGTVVVEAALRSGSLSTARFSGEQGRHVCAVPGHPLDPRAKGTNGLIKDGASLVTCAEDVFEMIKTQITPGDLNPDLETNTRNLTADGEHELRLEQDRPLDSDGSSRGFSEIDEKETKDLRAELFSLLGPSPIERDSLIRLLKCSTRDLQALLLELDLEGLIEHHGQQMISLK